MRIVQALGSSGRGGAERFFTRLVKAFHARGIPQVVLTRRKAWAAGQLGNAGIPMQTAWFAGKLDLYTRAKYRRGLAQLDATIAINWMPRATLACPAGPWVRVARLGKCYPLDAFSSCDHLIASSPRVAAHIVSLGWPESCVSQIPNFVAEVRTAPARRAAFNTPQDAPLIVWLGRMARDQGPDIAVRALAEVSQAYLWMAGSGPYEEEVKELAQQMGVRGRVRFLGWRDDVHALLKAADIFVHSSRDEGLGNVLDAWANGLPAIAPRLGDAGGLIADGETGLLVANDDPGALAAAIKTVISNRDFARRLGEAGKSQFQAKFSEEPVTTMYLDLCRRLGEDYAWRTKPLRADGGAAARPGFAALGETLRHLMHRTNTHEG